MRQIYIALMCIAAGLGLSAHAATDGSFPRLGAYDIGGPQNYDNSTVQKNLAKLDVVVLNVWPGWSNGRSMSMQQVVNNIKTMNPGERVFLYLDINELQSPASSAWNAVQDKLNQMNWWLYPSGSGGTPVKSSYGSNYNEINTTVFTPKDSDGLNFLDWYAKFAVTQFYTPSPSIDGFYTDNVFAKPRVNGDWNLDGTSDSQSSSTVASWYRDGYVAFINALRAQMPGKLQTGNVADWALSGSTIGQYDQQLNGGVLEGMIGYSWAPESWGGWKEMMREYRVIMAALASPKLAIFHQNGSSTDYQGFRYGFTSCLMDDAYYYFSNNNSYSQLVWFDEFDAKLGQAVSAPPTSAWSKGVYRRDFDNAIVLVNPKGNGAQSVVLEQDVQRLSGTQAPGVNSGAVVPAGTAIQLADRDGIVLLRTSAVARPAAPPTVSVQ